MTIIFQILLMTKLVLASQANVALNCRGETELKKQTNDSGTIEECISKSTGKTEGMRLEYDVKGDLRRSWNFKNGIPDGEFKVFDEKKQLVREGKFINGLPEGKMFRWYGKNKLQDETNWLNGRPHGAVKRYYKNGKTMEAGNYQVGRRVGIWKFNKEDGSSLPPRNYGEEFAGELTLQSFSAVVKVENPEDQSLKWASLVDVEKKQNKQASFLNARVEAESLVAGWTLQYGNQVFQPWDLEQKKITLDVPLNGEETKIQVVALGPENKKITYNLVITSQAPEFISQKPSEGVLKNSKLKLYVGASQRDYQEGTTIKSSYTNLTVGALLKRQMSSPHVELLASASYEGLTLVKPTGDGALNFLNIDGSAGYLTGETDSSLRLGLFAGLFYRTTNGQNYGLRSLSGPKLSPTIRFKMGDTQSVYAFYHYAPLFTKGMGVTPSSEIESSIEVGWSRQLASGREFSVLFNSTQMKITGINTQVDSKSSGIAFGYEF